VEEEKQRKKHKRNKMKVSEKLNPGAAVPAVADHNYDGLLLQRESGKTDSKEFPIKKNEKDDT
jgi:hypothetical protein